MRMFMFLIFAIICSCEDNPTIKSNGNQIKITNGFASTVDVLLEFEYKGHTYVSCKVKNGISLTHAGHCHCNKQSKD